MSIFRWRTFLKPILYRFFKLSDFGFCRITICGLLLFAQLQSLHAQDKPSEALAWHKSMALTLEHNPALTAYGHQLTAQEARLLQAGLKPNPELTVTVDDAFGSGNYQSMDSAETTLSISWLLAGHQRRERVNFSKTQSALLEVERDIARLDAAADTARLYITSLALQVRRQQIGQAVGFAGEAVKIIQKRVSAANSPAAELARVRVDLSRLLLEEEDIEHQILVTHKQLAAQWGSSQVDFSKVEGNLDELPAIADYSELQKRLRQNPRLEYFGTKVRVEESQLALAKAQARSEWRLSAGVKHLAATDDQAFVMGVSVPLGVMDRQQGRIAESRALIELNQAQRNAETIRLDTALFAVHQELLHSLHVVNSYSKEILPALEQILVETRRAYDLGRYSYLEWQSVQRDFLAAQNLLIEASVTAHLNAIEIERLTGVTPRTDQ
jgi:cobalt-zinc-cadmium efflux system outer membrane protein